MASLWRKCLFRACLLFFTSFTIFFAAPFFLVSFWSYSGDYKPILHHTFNVGDYELERSLTNLTHYCHGRPPDESHVLLLTVTQLINLHHKNITIAAIIWTTPLHNDSCPDHFSYIHPSFNYTEFGVGIWPNLLDEVGALHRFTHRLLCAQMQTGLVSFARFTPSSWEKEESYIGPTEQAQHVAHMVFNFTSVAKENASLFMQTFLLDYGTQFKGLPDSGNEQMETNTAASNYQTKTSCENMNLEQQAITCSQFYEGLLNESVHVVNPRQPTNGTIVYWKKNGFCVSGDTCGAVCSWIFIFQIKNEQTLIEDYSIRW